MAILRELFSVSLVYSWHRCPLGRDGGTRGGPQLRKQEALFRDLRRVWRSPLARAEAVREAGEGDAQEQNAPGNPGDDEDVPGGEEPPVGGSHQRLAFLHPPDGVRGRRLHVVLAPPRGPGRHHVVHDAGHGLPLPRGPVGDARVQAGGDHAGLGGPGGVPHPGDIQLVRDLRVGAGEGGGLVLPGGHGGPPLGAFVDDPGVSEGEGDPLPVGEVPQAKVTGDGPVPPEGTRHRVGQDARGEAAEGVLERALGGLHGVEGDGGGGAEGDVEGDLGAGRAEAGAAPDGEGEPAGQRQVVSARGALGERVARGPARAVGVVEQRHEHPTAVLGRPAEPALALVALRPGQGQEPEEEEGGARVRMHCDSVRPEWPLAWD